MNDRRLDVLRAIVSQYVHTREPVGSKAIAQSQDLGVSSATIRNDMAVLEEAGLIYQPHTSAGRVPTDKGYRAFVDQLSTLKPMSPAERQAVEKFLAQAQDLDDVVMNTVRLLAQVTHQVALIEYPVHARSTLSRIECVDLSDQRLLVVVITQQGKVFERLREMPQDVTQDDLLAVRAVLNAAYQGMSAAQVRAQCEALSQTLPPTLLAFATEMSDTVATLLQGEPSSRIAMAGMSNLARSGVDFHDIALWKSRLSFFVFLLRWMKATAMFTCLSALKTATMLSLKPLLSPEPMLPGKTPRTSGFLAPRAWTTPRQCPRSAPWPPTSLNS